MRRKPRYFRIIFALALVLGLLYFSLSWLLSPRDKWASLKESFVSVSTDHSAIIVLKEVVYKSLNSGHLEKPEEEGKKVKKGQIIASLVASMDAADEVSTSEDGQGGEAEATKEEEALSEEASQADEEGTEGGEKEKKEGLKKDEAGQDGPANKEGLRQDAILTFQNLNEALKVGDTNKALKLKRELQFKLSTLEKSESNLGLGLIENDRYIGSGAAKQGEKFSVISSESGQLSYYIDEYSGKLHLEQLYDFDYDRLFGRDIVSKNMKNAEFRRSEPVFKVINPSKWHIICELGMDDIESFSNQEKLSVIMEGKELKGEVIDQYVIGSRGLVLIEMRDPLGNLSEKRKTEVTIVHDKIAAVVIPFEALSSEGRQQGVYVRGINGEKVFRPIDIKHTNEEGYVVTSGSYTVKDEDGSLRTIDTVTSLDQVLIQNSH